MLMLYFFSPLFLPLSLSLSVSIRRQRAQEVQPKSKPGAFSKDYYSTKETEKNCRTIRRRDNSRKITPRICEPCAYYITMWPPHGYKLVQNPI
jgi:hypothetical protein